MSSRAGSTCRKRDKEDPHALMLVINLLDVSRRQSRESTLTDGRSLGRDSRRQTINVPRKYPGGNNERVTPVPIPNTAVKPLSVDGTALETRWESRSLPD
jgi:hypothetical protein